MFVVEEITNINSSVRICEIVIVLNNRDCEWKMNILVACCREVHSQVFEFFTNVFFLWSYNSKNAAGFGDYAKYQIAMYLLFFLIHCYYVPFSMHTVA